MLFSPLNFENYLSLSFIVHTTFAIRYRIRKFERELFFFFFGVCVLNLCSFRIAFDSFFFFYLFFPNVIPRVI